MKPIKFQSALWGAALMLSVASCSEAEIFSPTGGEEVKFTVRIPQNLTRSYGEGSNIDRIRYFVYEVTGPNTTTPVYNDVVEVKDLKNNEISIRLAKGVEYKIAFWADNTANSPYTINAENGQVTVDTEKLYQFNEYADAFSYVVNSLVGGEEATKEITLTRPVAQLNLGTNDSESTVVKAAYSNGVYCDVSYSTYTGMNLLTGKMTGETSGESQIPVVRQTVPADIAAATQGYPVSGYNYVGMVYSLVGDVAFNSAVKYDFHTGPSEVSDMVWTNTITEVPLKANFRTNIYGALLTSTSDFTVKVEAGFEGTCPVKFEELKKILENGTGDVSVVIGSDPEDKPATDETIVIPGVTDGNRHITIESSGEIPSISVGENVTIELIGGDDEDDGSTPASVSRRTRAEGTARYTAYQGSTIIVRKGTFRKGSFEKIFATEGGTIKIYGGTFYGQNISEFVADGCSAYEVSPNVYKVVEGAAVYDAASLSKALEFAKNTPDYTINVMRDFTFDVSADNFVFEGTRTKLVCQNNATITAAINLSTATVIPASNLDNYNKETVISYQGHGMIAPFQDNNTYYAPAASSFIVEQGASLILDPSVNITGAANLFEVWGNLIINGGTITSTAPYMFPAGQVAHTGKLIMNAGTINAKSRALEVYGAFTLNGGRILSESINGYAVTGLTAEGYDNKLVLAFNGGYVQSHYGCLDLSDGEWYIEGGEYKTVKRADVSRTFYALYSDTVDGMNHPNGTIAGGKFSVDPSCEYTLYLSDRPDVKVSGGEYSAPIFFGKYDGANEGMTFAPGYAWLSNDNAGYPYRVGKATAAARRR